ncbi:MAG TPA: DUF1800 family protein, partial [Candidatus Acidoferrum sp.]|nr:DUF1800 family protein [Candidatus Acidoferrum sp.]
MSDIWELLYGSQVVATKNLSAPLDSDRDGMSDPFEATAGTDPFDAGSVARISQVQLSTNALGASFNVFLNGDMGKRFQLQVNEAGFGNAAQWITRSTVVLRTNSVVTLATPADKPAEFFRATVGDVDTDGDGLNDWEEYQLGLDPLSATSNGQADENGTPLNDYDFIIRKLGLQSLESLLTPSAKLRIKKGDPFCGVRPAPKFAVAAALGVGSGLTGDYFTNASATYTNMINFHPTNLFFTTNNAAIDINWGPATTPNLSNGNYTVRWSGQVEPQYSELYFFETRADDGVKLWVNDQLIIDRWQIGNSTWTGSIQLVAGVRYNIRLEYFNRGGPGRTRLSWYSASQPRQVVPSSRLYPASGGYAPGAVTSPLFAVAFVGQPFTYTVAGANTPLGFGASNVPPGLSFNPTNGVISGIPTFAGNFNLTVSSSNSAGVGESVLQLEVIDSGSSVTREVWLGAAGTTVAEIPLHLPASQTNAIGNLEGISNFGDNYGERVRGFLIAPATGNYYFWIAGNSSAELWISNDKEPANKVRRAYVSNPKPTTPQQWNLQSNQQSAWLALVAGRRYYIEVLHKAGKGANDHWAVGWLLDPTGTNTAPSGVVPGYVLAPYVEPPANEIPGTLYSANMVAQAGALSSGVGSATLRLSADESHAVLRYSHAGLSAPVTAKHIHADTYLGKNGQGQIVFDIDTATQEADGSYIWNLEPSGPLTTADLIEIIKQGKAYINVHSVNYPGGEINGHFGLAAGTRKFTPPPLGPTWTADHANPNAAARFLQQATFGASPSEIKALKTLGYEGWINKQFKAPLSGHLTNVYANAVPNAGYPGVLTFNTWWRQSVGAPDQLRQRVAFALSQIMVVSETGPLVDNSRALSAYYDVLLKHSFGNFRDLLEDVTLSPAMGIYLDMRRNDKGNIAAGTHPNENYAREILQLFSVGLNRMWPDGTLVLNSAGDIVPTYDQDVIIGYSHVFTGWNYWQTNQANKRLPVNWNPGADYVRPMVLVPTHHELGTKRLLDNVVLPAASGVQLISTNTDFDTYCSRDLELALDSIFHNQNVGPFICRQLIQRLVTSHPSRDYLYRVVQKFNDNGKGVRGDMQAVIKAILLDYEARSANVVALPTSGKQREPLLRATAVARALPAPAPLKAKYQQTGSQTVIITTSKPHRLSSSDDVLLSFGKGGPPSQIYNNVTVIDGRTLAVNGGGATFATYGQVGTTITITNSGHGLSVGAQLYLTVSSGGARSGIHTVNAVLSGSAFTVNATVGATRAGSCAFVKWTDLGFNQTGSNITFTTSRPHDLTVGKSVYINFQDGQAPDGVYRIASVPSLTRFTVIGTVAANRNDSATVLPLVGAPVFRSGAVTLHYNNWNMNYTDGGFSSSLSQTPLNSPTVFNFFFPDYKF